MNRVAFSILAAAAIPLAACTSTSNDTVASASPPPIPEAPAYETTPAYQPASATRCPSVGGSALTGAAGGAALGAGVGAISGGVGVLEGAAVGAAVGGLGGAIWADANNDGCVDGYVREGQYYSGSPVVQPTQVAYTGERG